MDKDKQPTVSIDEVWNGFSVQLRRFIANRVHAEADVDDILQEVFLKIHRGIDKLQDQSKLHAWEFINRLRPLTANINSNLRHRLDGQWSYVTRVDAGTRDLKAIAASWRSRPSAIWLLAEFPVERIRTRFRSLTIICVSEFLGNTAQSVMNHAQCPVEIVPVRRKQLINN